MSTRNKALSSLLVAAITLSLAAIPPVKKLSATGFVGRSGDTTVIVDTGLALQVEKEKYLPLVVWLGHTERGSQKATRESFSLLAPTGETLAMAAISEVTSEYGPNRISGDYSRLRMNAVHFEYAEMYFLNCRPVRNVAYFPNPSGIGVKYDHVELPRFSWFRALMYFPVPAGKAHGDYIFRYADAKGGVTVEVPFTLN